MYSFLRLILAACILSLSSLSACILSAEGAAQRPVVRSVYADFYPYSFTSNDGKAQGYSVDLTRQLADMAGYDVQFIAAENPKQFIEMMDRSEVDVTPLLGLTPARRAAGLATSALGEFDLSVFVRRGSGTEHIEDLSGFRVGAVAGAITQAAAEHIPFAKIVIYQTSDDLLLPLLNGEIDAVVSVAETFQARLRKNFIDDKVRRLVPSLTIIPYGLIVRRDLPDLHRALEHAIARTVTPEALAPLRATWFGRDQSIMEHPWFLSVLQIVGGISVALISLGFYAVRLRRRSARLLVKNGENQLLIDALDQIRGAIAIFDHKMTAVHWNSGFEVRFPQIVPLLRDGADIELTQLYAYQNDVFLSDGSEEEARERVAQTANMLRDGKSVQRIVHTPQGSTFDLSIFPLGARHFAAIWVDVTDLHQQQERIASQSNELVRKNQQLMAFSAMAAHDLKAPLVQQAALMEFILEDVADAQITLPDEARNHFATLADLSQRMNTLVRDLLVYAKSDTTHAAPNCFDPEARLDSILKLSCSNPMFKITVEPGIPAVQVEPNAFDLVMRNLITNAVKHHDKAMGHIMLRGFHQGDKVLIEVEDDGPGIDAAQQDRVFEPFCRLTKVEGTGLGLAFVRKTVDTWGGTITLKAAPERGCIFQITLPAAPDNVVTIPSAQQPKLILMDKPKARGTS